MSEQIEQVFPLSHAEHESIYRKAEEARRRAGSAAAEADTARWIAHSSDGFIAVKRDDNNEVISLPSHLKVVLRGSAAGRDQITIMEGIWNGVKANVKGGNLESANPNYGAASIAFRNRAGGPVDIDGQTYDKEIEIRYRDAGGHAKQVGPHPAKTHPTNPVPTGNHVAQIPDYPHDANPAYGLYRNVWFRIGESGDRYIHPGRVSLGCITCAPRNWPDIYMALRDARKGDAINVGDLRVS